MSRHNKQQNSFEKLLQFQMVVWYSLEIDLFIHQHHLQNRHCFHFLHQQNRFEKKLKFGTCLVVQFIFNFVFHRFEFGQKRKRIDWEKVLSIIKTPRF